MTGVGSATSGSRAFYALLVAPFPVWLQLCALSLAAYQTLVLLALLLAGRGCSTLRYRRVFQFWIVYGLGKATTTLIRELCRSVLQLSFWVRRQAPTTAETKLIRGLVQLHAWTEAMFLVLLVFPVHRGFVDTIAPLLTVGGTSLVDIPHRVNAPPDRGTGWSATSTNGARISSSTNATLGASPARRTLSENTVWSWNRRRRWAPVAFHLFELAAWIYQRLLLPQLEKIEPEVDLALGRLRSQLRQVELALKELLSFCLAWVLANSGNAAEAAMLGNAALHGAQIGLAERLARVRRTASALMEREYGSIGTHRLDRAQNLRFGRARLNQLRPRHELNVAETAPSASMNALRQADWRLVTFPGRPGAAPNLEADDAAASAAVSNLSGTRSLPMDSVSENALAAADEDAAPQTVPSTVAQRALSSRTANRAMNGPAVGIDASEGQPELSSSSLALLPLLAAPFTEPQHFPRSFRSTEEEATRQMYATDDILWMYRPILHHGWDESPPNPKPSTTRTLWRTLSTVFRGASRSCTVHTNHDRRSYGYQADRVNSDSTPHAQSSERKMVLEGSRQSRNHALVLASPQLFVETNQDEAFHGSMMLPRSGEYDAAFLDGAGAVRPQSRARAYERVRLLRKGLRKPPLSHPGHGAAQGDVSS